MGKTLHILVVLSMACCGCVSQRSCSLKNTPNSTIVTVSKDWHGLLVGICGFTTHTSTYYVFELPGHKAEYVGSEIDELTAAEYYTNRYDGSISIVSTEKRIVVKLRQNGSSFELNGVYHYP